MLVRLLYASRAVDTSAAAIESILGPSRAHNTASGITGILCYGQGIFLQAIEGGRTAISDLYGHIQKDPRHKDVVLLHFEEIAERREDNAGDTERNRVRFHGRIRIITPTSGAVHERARRGMGPPRYG